MLKRPAIPSVRENEAINVVRAAAALLFAANHLRQLFFQDYAQTAHSPIKALVYAPLSLGPESVIVFFVLSGYWVGGGALRSIALRRFSWRNYMVNRLTRLWLVLIPALFLTLVLDKAGAALMSDAGVYSDPSQYVVLPSNPSHSVLTFLGNLASLEGLHVPVYGYNAPLWSVSYEVLCYGIFPAAVLAFSRGTGRRAKVFSGVVLVAAVAIGGAPAMALFMTWLLGAAVAWQRPRIIQLLGRCRPRHLALARGVAAAATVAMMLAARRVVGVGLAEGLLIAVPTTALLGLLTVDLDWRGWAGRALARSARLAHSSYSLFAIHVPVLVFVAAALVPDSNQRWNMDVAHAAAGLAILVGVVIVAVFFAYATEMRIGVVRRRILGLVQRTGRHQPHNKTIVRTTKDPAGSKNHAAEAPRHP